MAAFDTLPAEILTKIAKYLCDNMIDRFDSVAPKDLQTMRLLSHHKIQPVEMML